MVILIDRKLLHWAPVGAFLPVVPVELVGRAARQLGFLKGRIPFNECIAEKEEPRPVRRRRSSAAPRPAGCSP